MARPAGMRQSPALLTVLLLLFTLLLSSSTLSWAQTPGTILTIAGNGDNDFSGDDGPATAASLDNPTDVFVDAAGSVYIADTDNHRIRKVIAVPAISVAPASLNFGNLNVGQTTSRTVTISNPSAVPLTVSSLTVAGTDSGQFTVDPTSANVASAGSQAVTVNFTPTSGGTKTAHLTIQHDAAGDSTSVPLTGMGISAVALSMPVLFGEPNADLTVPIQISGVASATGIYSYSFTLDYGTNGLLTNPQAIQDGTLSQGSGIEVNPAVGAGKVRIAGVRVFAIPGDGILLKLRFRVKATATPNDSTRLTLTDVLFNEGDPTPTLTGGTVKVARGPFGDLTLDGSVSALDAAAALQTDVGLRTLTLEQKTTGDVSGNGAVTAFDAALILQFVVGQISKFPVQGQTKPLPDEGGPIASLPRRPP